MSATWDFTHIDVDDQDYEFPWADGDIDELVNNYPAWMDNYDPLENLANTNPVEPPSSSSTFQGEWAAARNRPSTPPPRLPPLRDHLRTNALRPYQELQQTRLRPMGSASSSTAHDHNFTPHQSPPSGGTNQSRQGNERTERRRAAAYHSEDWLDRESTRQDQNLPFNPEELFPELREQEEFGSDIEILGQSSSDEESDIMPTPRRRRQNQTQTQDTFVDLTNDSSPVQRQREPVSLKRSAEASQSRPNKRKRTPEPNHTNVEELDLTNEAPSAEEEILANQREAAIKAQAAAASAGPLGIGKRTCIICMESFTNATITSCGHIFCHECLTQALRAGEKNSERGVGNCPVCRKPVQRKKANQVIPVSFMKKAKFKGKARRDMQVLG